MAAESRSHSLDSSEFGSKERIELEGLEGFFENDHSEMFSKGLSIKQAVFYYGDNRRSLKAKVLDGTIPAIRLPEAYGGKWRIFPDGVPEQLQDLIPKKLRHKELDESSSLADADPELDQDIESVVPTEPVAKQPKAAKQPKPPKIKKQKQKAQPEAEAAPIDFSVPEKGNKVLMEPQQPPIPSFLADFVPDFNLVEAKEYDFPPLDFSVPGVDGTENQTQTTAKDRLLLPGIDYPGQQILKAAGFLVEETEAKPAEPTDENDAGAKALACQLLESSQPAAEADNVTVALSKPVLEQPISGSVSLAIQDQPGTGYADLQSANAPPMFIDITSQFVDLNTQFTAGLVQPTAGLVQPTDGLVQPTDGLAQPTDELAQTTDELAQTINDLVQVNEAPKLSPSIPSAFNALAQTTSTAEPGSAGGSPAEEPNLPNNPPTTFALPADTFAQSPAISLASLAPPTSFSPAQSIAVPSIQIDGNKNYQSLLNKISELEKQVHDANYRNSYLEARLTGLEDQLKFLTQSHYAKRSFDKLLLLIPALAVLATILICRLHI